MVKRLGFISDATSKILNTENHAKRVKDDNLVQSAEG